MKKPQKKVHPLFLGNDIVEAVRNFAAEGKYTLKAAAEILIREALEARAAASVKP